MVILYNESDTPYNNRRIPSKGTLNKIIKARKSQSRGKTIIRQCFILLEDASLVDYDLEPYVNMKTPMILSGESHKIIFGNKDLNPIGWRVKDDNYRKKNIFLLTLKNGINSYFQTSDTEDLYILEYAVSRGELSIIISRDDRKEPFRFDLYDNESKSVMHYTISVEEGEVRFMKEKEYLDSLPVMRPLKKFRPAIATEYILTEDSEMVFRDEKLNHSMHTIMEVTMENIEEVIQFIRDKSVKAVTFYGPETEENEPIRAILQRNFRIFYVMNAFRVMKRKIG